MSLSQKEIDKLAVEILDAERSGKQISNAVDQYPEITFDEAYAVQTQMLRIREKEGDPVVGHKAGLSQKAWRGEFGQSQPVFGHFHASMVVPEGEPLSISRFCHHPFVEGEMAFVLKDDLKGPGITLPKVMASVMGVIPAFEIADTRWKEKPRNVNDIIAENAAAALVMFGGQFNKIDGIDLRQIGHILERDGEVINTGAMTNVCSNPLLPIVYMANKLAEFGMGLKAGEFIITGTPLAASLPEIGTCLRATFDRIGYVTVRFVA